MTVLLKRNSKVNISLHFPGLVTVHYTQVKRAQCKIIRECQCIPRIKIRIGKKFTCTYKIVEENICSSYKICIDKYLLTQPDLCHQHSRRVNRSFLKACKSYLVTEQFRHSSDNIFIHQVAGIVEVNTRLRL